MFKLTHLPQVPKADYTARCRVIFSSVGNMATPQNYAIYIGKSIFEEKKM